MSRRRVVSAAIATLLATSFAVVALGGIASADAFGSAGCKALTELRGQRTFSKSEREDLLRAAKLVRRSSVRGAEKMAKRVRASESNAQRASAVKAVLGWCADRHLLTSTASAPATTRAVSPELAKSAIKAGFDAVQPQALDVLRQNPLIEAVRDLSYDTVSNTINLDVLSTFQSSPDNARDLYDEQAWQITSGISVLFWTQKYIDTLSQIPGGGVALLPAFHIRMEDVLEYQCSPDQMVAIAAKSAGMQDFVAQCVKA